MYLEFKERVWLLQMFFSCQTKYENWNATWNCGIVEIWKKNLGGGGGIQSGWMSLVIRQKRTIIVATRRVSWAQNIPQMFFFFAAGASDQRFNSPPRPQPLNAGFTTDGHICVMLNSKVWKGKGIRHHKIFGICNVGSHVVQITFLMCSNGLLFRKVT